MRYPALAATFVLTLAAAASSAIAAEVSGIAVVAKGTARARPSVVELTGTVSGEAELAADAITKFRGNRQRAVEAIEGLEIEGLTIQGKGISFNSSVSQAQLQAMMMGGMAEQNTGNEKLTVSEPLVIRLEGVAQMETEPLLETLVKIIDAGKDAGIVIGAQPANPLMYQYSRQQSAPLALFKLEDVNRLKQQAYEEAMQQARAQAERLAELAGAKVGPVTSIREIDPESEGESAAVDSYWAMMFQMMNEEGDKKFSSSDLKEIPVPVTLRVEFAIVNGK